MADPLSFVVSIVALVQSTDSIATKGYRYLKVVKNARDDVRSLIAEVDVLSGVLSRLQHVVEQGEREALEDLCDQSDVVEEVGSDNNSICGSQRMHGGEDHQLQILRIYTTDVPCSALRTASIHLRMPENIERH